MPPCWIPLDTPQTQDTKCGTYNLMLTVSETGNSGPDVPAPTCAPTPVLRYRTKHVRQTSAHVAPCFFLAALQRNAACQSRKRKDAFTSWSGGSSSRVPLNYSLGIAQSCAWRLVRRWPSICGETVSCCVCVPRYAPTPTMEPWTLCGKRFSLGPVRPLLCVSFTLLDVVFPYSNV